MKSWQTNTDIEKSDKPTKRSTNGAIFTASVESSGSSGLGLSIVRTLVTTELGGTIEMRSGAPADFEAADLHNVRPGDGAVVDLTRPLLQSAYETAHELFARERVIEAALSLFSERVVNGTRVYKVAPADNRLADLGTAQAEPLDVLRA